MKCVHKQEHMGGQQHNNKENKFKHDKMALLNSSEKVEME